MTITFRPMEAEDVLRLAVQPSQVMGIFGPVADLDHGRALVSAGAAWSAVDADGRPLVCAGIGESIPGHVGVAWALLATSIGAAHLAITRFARRQILGSPLKRIEAIVRCDQHGGRAWAEACGLELNTVLFGHGRDGSPHYLFERVI